MIWVLANIHFDDGLLGRFLEYYRSKGVDRFGIVYHGPTIPEELYEIDIELRLDREPYMDGPTDNMRLMEMRESFVGSGDWYIPADLDEFHRLPGLQDFASLIDESYDYIPSRFVDRLANDGGINPLLLGALDTQFPLESTITKDICKGCIDKVMFIRGRFNTASGHHYAEQSAVSARFTGQTHHFKWQGVHFWDWMFRGNRRADDCHGVEFAPFLAHFQQFGRINVFDTRLSIFKAPKLGI